MAGACPGLSPDDPLVRGLLGVVDCNVQVLAHGGYSALFAPNALFAGVLSTVLVIYVALIGYRLMFARTGLGAGDFALTAVKVGAVLALATQWATYQAVVYDTLFHGPEQLATAVLDSMQPGGSQFRGNVFVGLQRAFDDLSAAVGAYADHGAATGTPAAPATPTAVPSTNPLAPGAMLPAPPPTTPAKASGVFSGGQFGALLLTGSAALLLMSTLGVLLAAKIVLGVLLGVGPIFIALLLFDATRGLFEGWLRASLGFAFAPLMATLLAGVAIAMLEPSLGALDSAIASNLYPLEPVYTVTILAVVFGLVSLGMLVAAGVVSWGLRLPGRQAQAGRAGAAASAAPAEDAAVQPRAARVAAAATALDRRDGQVFAAAAARGAAGERRTTVSTVTAGAAPRVVVDLPMESRLGQGARRSAQPRSPRTGPSHSAQGARTA